MSPELLFTHFPLEKSFLKGDKTKYYTNKDITEKSFTLDTTNFNFFSFRNPSEPDFFHFLLLYKVVNPLFYISFLHLQFHLHYYKPIP